MKSKVFVETSDHTTEMLFRSLQFSLVTDINHADLVVFTGGADVSPHLYGDHKHPYTGNNPLRDVREQRTYNYARELNIPMVGICRGGQFLNVMSGGRMYQHVSNHTMSHEIVDVITGETVYVTSTHHQMMMPSEKGLIVAVSSGVSSDREWFDQEVFRRDNTDQGIEVVFYEHTKSLCFQPHPEYNNGKDCPMRQYFSDLLGRYLKV